MDTERFRAGRGRKAVVSTALALSIAAGGGVVALGPGQSLWEDGAKPRTAAAASGSAHGKSGKGGWERTTTSRAVPEPGTKVATESDIGTRAAATNGVQISFCSWDKAEGRHYAVASGTNQRGRKVTTRKIKLPGRTRCANLPNWWWKGKVDITWHGPKGKVRTRCAVPTTTRSSDWINCDDWPVHYQFVYWLNDEITKNLSSPTFRYIKKKNGQRFGRGKPQALWAWRQAVKPHGPWDHKDYLSQRFTGRKYELDTKRGTYFFQWDDDYLLSYDIWSNFHYGYIGRRAGFGSGTLHRAHQVPGAGKTDAGDKATVDLGIKYFEKYGNDYNRTTIASFIEANRDKLVRTGVAKRIP